MKEIWVLIKNVSVVQGHGMSGDEPVLAYREWDTHNHYPSFASREDAEIYISSLGNRGSGLIPVRMDMWNGNGKATKADLKQDKARDGSWFR